MVDSQCLHFVKLILPIVVPGRRLIVTPLGLVSTIIVVARSTIFVAAHLARSVSPLRLQLSLCHHHDDAPDSRSQLTLSLPSIVEGVARFSCEGEVIERTFEKLLVEYFAKVEYTSSDAA